LLALPVGGQLAQAQGQHLRGQALDANPQDSFRILLYLLFVCYNIVKSF